MTTYKLINDINGNPQDGVILHVQRGAFVPFDPDNTDYQEYLKWLAEGNEPLPAD